MKKKENREIFTEIELDPLREIMNISFGSASTDLAELMDIFIHLNIPEIHVVSGQNLISHLSHGMLDFDTCSIVQQEYYGDFDGKILLVFPYGIEKELLSYFQNPEALTFQSDELVELEKEFLLEIGNLLIGACMGKFYEFMDTSISYLPPQCFLGRKYAETFASRSMRKIDSFISIKTNFCFEDRRVAGYLYLIYPQEAAEHLKKGLLKFKETPS